MASNAGEPRPLCQVLPPSLQVQTPFPKKSRPGETGQGNCGTRFRQPKRTGGVAFQSPPVSYDCWKLLMPNQGTLNWLSILVSPFALRALYLWFEAAMFSSPRRVPPPRLLFTAATWAYLAMRQNPNRTPSEHSIQSNH